MKARIIFENVSHPKAGMVIVYKGMPLVLTQGDLWLANGSDVFVMVAEEKSVTGQTNKYLIQDVEDIKYILKNNLIGVTAFGTLMINPHCVLWETSGNESLHFSVAKTSELFKTDETDS